VEAVGSTPTESAGVAGASVMPKVPAAGADGVGHGIVEKQGVRASFKGENRLWFRLVWMFLPAFLT
jgi:hypothetical protein